MRRTLLGLATATLLLAVPATAQAITNGEPDVDHTYSGAIVAVAPEWDVPDPIAWCSGTLVAPTVFLTAAHCLVGLPPEVTLLGVTFDPNVSDGVDHLVPIDAVQPHPSYDGVNSDADIPFDMAAVTLGEPVTDVGYAALPTLRQFDGLKPGPRSWFTAVGYGVQLDRGTQRVDVSERRVATRHLLRTHWFGDASMWELSGAKGTGGGTCSGDSGGSLLWKDTDLLVAVHSAGFKQCVQHGFDARLDTPSAQAFLAQVLG
jgi:Trypsin